MLTVTMGATGEVVRQLQLVDVASHLLSDRSRALGRGAGGKRKANSSPPIRATMSPGRESACCMAWAILVRHLSPA